MASNTEWNPKKIYNELAKWLARPSSRQLRFDDAVQEIERYLRGEPLRSGYGTLTGCLHDLSVWHSSCFVVGAFNGEQNAILNMYRSFHLDYLDALIISAHYNAGGHEGNLPWMSYNSHGLYLAKGLALGCLNYAERLGEVILQNVKSARYIGLNKSTVAPFVLKLYCSWQGLAVRPEHFGVLPEFYEEILSSWMEGNVHRLTEALLLACDYHIERSREHTDSATYEFVDEVDRVFPAEILAVLRLRLSLGLSLPELDHPLMNTTVAKFQFVKDIPMEEILEKVIKKATSELNVNLLPKPLE